MAHEDVFSHQETVGRAPDFGRLGREFAFGFAYWLTFVLLFEPGKIGHAILAGVPIAWDQEVLRLTGAGLLGATATPAILALVRRFPIEGPARWRNATFHLAASAAISVGLIAASCVLAAWLLASEHRPFAEALRDEMASNVLLLTFCIAALLAIAHAVRFSRSDRIGGGGAAPLQPATRRRTQVSVKTRAGLLMVEMEDIDWIETQGNYLALHIGSQVHLLRETSRRFETMLDPSCFVRVHRRTVVAIDRIRKMTPLGSGDAVIRLDTGAELRVSRGYREHLQAQLNAVTRFSPSL